MTTEMIEIKCGKSLTIADATALYAQLLNYLAEGQAVTLNVSEIERIDTAAIQLLYSFYRDANALGNPLKWRGASEAFYQGVRMLGLAQQMDIDDPAGERLSE